MSFTKNHLFALIAAGMVACAEKTSDDQQIEDTDAPSDTDAPVDTASLDTASLDTATVIL